MGNKTNISTIATTENLVDNKTLRDQHIERLEVLDKVKELLLIPEMEVMTTKMIADYYEVPLSTIKDLFGNNRIEIESDGSFVYKTSKEFLETDNPSTRINRLKGKKEVEFSNGLKIVVPNINIRVFTKRACLRIGFLLRDSKIAKEIRTQLLNVFETTTDEQRTIHFTEETKLIFNTIEAYNSGDIEKYFVAQMELNQYNSRNKAMLESSIKVLEENNSALSAQNKMLADGIAEWGEREICNRLIRYMAMTCTIQDKKKPVGSWWNMSYKALLYKHGISLNNRSGGKSLLSRVTDAEMPLLVQVIATIAQHNGVDFTFVLNPVNAEKVQNTKTKAKGESAAC